MFAVERCLSQLGCRVFMYPRCTGFTAKAAVSRIVLSLDGVPERITKRVVRNLDSAFPERPIVPSTEVVHDRIMLEVFRGVPGLLFCQVDSLPPGGKESRKQF